MGPLVWRRIPWTRLWLVSVWLYQKGRDRLEKNLSHKERRELLELMRKSKARPGHLSPKQRERFRSLVRQAATGRGG